MVTSRFKKEWFDIGGFNMADEKIVQGEEAPKGEVSKETPSGEVKKPQAQPSVEELVEKALNTKLEPLIRKFQSEKDKSIAQADRRVRDAERKAQFAESRIESIRRGFSQDPDQANVLRQADADAVLKMDALRQQEDRRRGEVEAYVANFNDTMSQFIEGEGIDPSDKRLDWAEDAVDANGTPDLLTRTKRIQKSVSTINKENRTVWQKKMEQTMEDRFANLRKEAGLDSADVETSKGAQQVSDADFLKKLGAGDIPVNKENIDRYDRIKKSYK